MGKEQCRQSRPVGKKVSQGKSPSVKILYHSHMAEIKSLRKWKKKKKSYLLTRDCVQYSKYTWNIFEYTQNVFEGLK